MHGGSRILSPSADCPGTVKEERVELAVAITDGGQRRDRDTGIAHIRKPSTDVQLATFNFDGLLEV